MSLLTAPARRWHHAAGFPRPHGGAVQRGL